jgi:hypothetical protein
MDATADELIARLRRNPDDASAYASLRAHYQRTGDHASLANLLEGWAGRSANHQAAAQAFFEAGELAFGSLGDQPRGMRFYERTLERNPAHVEAGFRLQTIYEESGDQRRLAELLERRVEALTQAGGAALDIAALHHRLGEIWEHAWKRADKAVFHYRKAFELDPTLVPAMYAAREIYRQAGNVKAAATLCELEAKAEPDPERKVALLRELAHVRAADLSDLDGAVVALKRALGIMPGDLDVMIDLAGFYRQRAEQNPDARVADADLRRAADVLYQIAQKLPPATAVPHLETALDGVPDHDGALALLERIAERVGHFELLPRRWVAFLSRAPDAPSARERRRRLAKAYLDAGQIDYAITCLEWLLEEGDAEAASNLVRLYREHGRDDAVTRALSVAARGLPPAERIAPLRELMQLQSARGDDEAALSAAREILAIDAIDSHALSYAVERLRKAEDWSLLRVLLLAAADVHQAPLELRKEWLREAVFLSDRRLFDLDSAIDALRRITEIDPSDREARDKWAAMLESAERWDELADLLEEETVSILDPHKKAAHYKRLAYLHHERRGNLDLAIAALRNQRDLVPGDPDARNALCDTLLVARAYDEALPMLRQRLDQATGSQRAELARVLARATDEHRGDHEETFAAWARVLESEPSAAEALERMEQIDERSGNYARLLTTLAHRTDLELGPERAAIFTRMGRIADESLNDIRRATEYYRRARELSPRDEAIVEALCSAYDRSERFQELVDLLQERADFETNREPLTLLLRRIAHTYRDRINDQERAADAFRDVLEIGEDPEALAFLYAHARNREDWAECDQRLERLAAIETDAEKKRDFLIERARLFSERLDRPRDAIDLLRTVTTEFDPNHWESLRTLVSLSERLDDSSGVADALERMLRIAEDGGERVGIARRLAEIYDRDPDPARAIAALEAWAEADLTDPTPVRRLTTLLEQTERWKDLVIALDTLSDLGDDSEENRELTRRSADVAYRRLGDIEGAWERLSASTAQGDAEAEKQLREMARAERLGERLAAFYVSLAEVTTDNDEKKRRFVDAAQIYEKFVENSAESLEMMLRAFAFDLDDRNARDEVDRLAKAADSWPRLAQVYETLVRRAEEPKAKAELLLHHAALLEEDGRDPSAAFDRVLRACALLPREDEVLKKAEYLSLQTDRAEDLLVAYDRRRAALTTDEERVETLLRAVRVCALRLEDESRAISLIAQAVSLAVREIELAPSIENAIRDIDREREDDSKKPLMRGLVDVYRALAQSLEGEDAARLWQRAGARLLELGDTNDAWDALIRGASIAPSDETSLDALEELASRTERLALLDEHLMGWIRDALDSSTATSLLRRRGKILEVTERWSDAADVYSHLKMVAPHDENARIALRSALRRAERYQDLLLALDSEISKARGDRERELALRKESALTWERNLKNKWEALESWGKVLKLAPEDGEAKEAIRRLKEHKSPSSIEYESEPDEAAGGEPREAAESAPENRSDSDNELPHSEEIQLLTDHPNPSDIEPESEPDEAAGGESREAAESAPENRSDSDNELPHSEEIQLLTGHSNPSDIESESEPDEATGGEPREAAESAPENRSDNELAHSNETVLELTDDASEIEAVLEAEDDLEEVIESIEMAAFSELEEPMAPPPPPFASPRMSSIPPPLPRSSQRPMAKPSIPPPLPPPSRNPTKPS